jgi:hypothetical protein
MNIENYYVRRKWAGFPPEILINYGPIIQEIIKGNKLTPVSALPSMGAAVKASTRTIDVSSFVDWWWKYGGMKAWHLHYAGEVYALNEAQWQQFSSTVIKDFAKKLTASKSISFDNFVKIADAAVDVI